jgi:hypothetical protein
MPKFNARINKDKKQLRITDRSLFDQYIADEAEKKVDYLYEIEITRLSKAKSREQENFRWGVLYPEILHGLKNLGWNEVRNKDDVHDIVKALFLKKEIVNEGTGEVFTIPDTTKNLSVEQEQQLQEDMRLWAAEFLGISLSEPNEQKSINFNS